MQLSKEWCTVDQYCELVGGWVGRGGDDEGKYFC